MHLRWLATKENSGPVSYSRLDKAPPRSLTPDRQYRRQRPLQLVNMIHRALGPTGRGLPLKITACTTTKKGPSLPRDHSADRTLLYAARSHV